MNTQTSTSSRGILHLISRTPLRDIARFRLSGRLDFERHLTDLPAPVADHIRAVIRRTRLWRLEKVDIARELAAHCADGLARGRSPDQVIQSFGQARPAARLIALAARRKRSLASKVFLRAAQTAAILALIALIAYTYFAIRYFGNHATIARNYAAEMNAPIAAIPADQRALVPYHQARAALGAPRSGEDMLTMIRPGDPRWPAAVDYLHNHAEALDMARRAADLPHLGAIVRGDLDPALYPSAAGAPPAPANPMLMTTLAPHLGEMRRLAQHLIADIRLAAFEHDADRVAADAQAILKMSNHIREQPTLIGDHVSLAILSSGLNELGRTLHDHPDLLSELQLKLLAHRIAGWAGGGPLAARLDFERATFDDLLQRTFSDNGRGDGHPTADGAKLLDSLANSSGDPANVALRRITQPVASAMMASRREQRAAYGRMLDRADAHAQRPLWEWDTIAPPDAFQRSLLDNPTPAQRLRYLPVLVLLPSIEKSAAIAEYATQARDAALVAIALTLHRLHTGAYPVSLGALVPAFLPAIPPDRFDGGPIRYRLADGAPILYSIGVDRKDDGGQPPALSERTSRVEQWLPAAAVAAKMTGPSAAFYKGDWILWPAPPPPPPPMPEP